MSSSEPRDATSFACASGSKTPSRVPAASAPMSSSDRKSTRLNSSHLGNSDAVFCLKQQSLLAGFVHADDIFAPEVEGDYDDHHGARDLNKPQSLLAGFVHADDIFAPVFFNDTAATEIYTLSLQDALPI